MSRNRISGAVAAEVVAVASASILPGIRVQRKTFLHPLTLVDAVAAAIEPLPPPSTVLVHFPPVSARAFRLGEFGVHRLTLYTSDG